MTAAIDLTVQMLSPCLGAFLKPRFTKTYTTSKGFFQQKNKEQVGY